MKGGRSTHAAILLTVVLSLFLGAGVLLLFSGPPLRKVFPKWSPLDPDAPFQPAKFHLVLTSCFRPQGGRIISTALLSAWLNDAQPHTVTIVWCKHYNASFEMLSLYQNLKYSNRLRVIHVPDHMQEGMTSHYYTALRVPEMLRQTDIPLIVCEEDVFFAPDFNRKLQTAISLIKGRAGGKPYFINLYNPGLTGPVQTLLEEYNRRDKDGQWPKHKFQVRQGSKAYGYGIQGIYYTPAMREIVARWFHGVMEGLREVPGLPDMILHSYVYKEGNCSQPNSGCEMFAVSPSLVEHTGATSALFGANNSRFHMTQDFMMKIKWPSFDPENAW